MLCSDEYDYFNQMNKERAPWNHFLGKKAVNVLVVFDGVTLPSFFHWVSHNGVC